MPRHDDRTEGSIPLPPTEDLYAGFWPTVPDYPHSTISTPLRHFNIWVTVDALRAQAEADSEEGRRGINGWNVKHANKWLRQRATENGQGARAMCRPPDGTQENTRHVLRGRGTNIEKVFVWTGKLWETPGTGYGTRPVPMGVLGWSYVGPEAETN